MTINAPKTREDLVRVLAQMRLAPEVFERAVSVGAAESRTYSEAAPKSAPNSARWFRTVEVLHEELMLLNLDWKRTNPDNLPYFCQEDLNMGLIASSGDVSTGVVWARPSTQNPKGRAFARRVDENRQGELFPRDEISRVPTTPTRDLWILLYHEREGLVYLELSRPKSMSGSQIDDWLDRIVFPPFDLAIGAFAFDGKDGDDPGLAFTITRR